MRAGAGRKRYEVASFMRFLSKFFPRARTKLGFHFKEIKIIHFPSVERSTLDPRFTS